MARLIAAYCREHHLVYVETGTRDGEAVLWFRDYQGRRVCIPAADVHGPPVDGRRQM